MSELVGYLRFDTEAELKVLNEIWELDRVFTNYLLAQQKLVFKRCEGAKVTKRHDTAATPRQRTLAWEGLTAKDRKVIDKTFAGVRSTDAGVAGEGRGLGVAAATA